MTKIAGHTFADTAGGRRCIDTDYEGNPCWRSWLSIRDCTADDLGQPNIAHAGALNDEELATIIKERAREEDCVWEAVRDAASSGSR